jgi:sulfonate transport system substrate-binding protein
VELVELSVVAVVASASRPSQLGHPRMRHSPALSRRLMSAAKRPLRVGGVPEHFNTPWHTAAANGRFQREAGVAVEWVEFPGGTGAMTKALRDESIDVAILLTEGIVADLHRGNPSKIVGTYVGTPLTWGVHVPAGSPVRDVEGLRADGAPARYAVSRMGSGSHLMAVVDARSRGWEPATALEFEIVGGLDGCRAAFRDGGAAAHRLAFMWEKFTTKPYVDGGEFARIGECVTPWPCFLVAASDAALAAQGDAIVAALRVVREEAARLRKAPDLVAVISKMYGLAEADVAEWLGTVAWESEPAVSHAMLARVMETLADVGVLERADLVPPSALVSALTRNLD